MRGMYHLYNGVQPLKCYNDCILYTHSPSIATSLRVLYNYNTRTAEGHCITNTYSIVHTYTILAIICVYILYIQVFHSIISY